MQLVWGLLDSVASQHIGKVMNAKVMSEQQMFEQVTADIRALRNRVDGHIDDQVERFERVAKDIAKIQVDMAGHKGRIETKVAMIAGGISVFVTGATAWVVRHWSG